MRAKRRKERQSLKNIRVGARAEAECEWTEIETLQPFANNPHRHANMSVSAPFRLWVMSPCLGATRPTLTLEA